jgi:hypothetical protein
MCQSNILILEIQNTHLRLSATPTSVALLLLLQYIIATPAMHLTRITKRQYGFRGIHLKAPQLWILGGGFCKEPNVMRFQEIQPWCRPCNKLHALTIIRLFGSLHDDMDSMTFVIPPYSFHHFRVSTRFRERRCLKPRRRCPVYPSESTG